MPAVVLASGSPRRTRLLTLAGVAHTVVVPGIPEPPGSTPLALAGAKLDAALAGMPRPDAIVLAADTVVCDAAGRVYAKPVDDAEARQMLRRMLVGRPRAPQPRRRALRALRVGAFFGGIGADPAGDAPGATISVVSGVAIARPDGTRVVATTTTSVRLRRVGEDAVDAVIDTYLAAGEHRDKAAALSLQGAASGWIVGIDGCASNAVGLPVCVVTRELAAAGVRVPGMPARSMLGCGPACSAAAAACAPPPVRTPSTPPAVATVSVWR